jgi:hypothetical protein
MRFDATNLIANRAWQPTALAALASGLYLSIFYIAGNFTMLTPASALVVAIGFTLPIVLALLVTIVVLSMTRLHNYIGFATAFVCALYLAFALRVPIFESQVVSAFLGQLRGGSRLAANVLYLLIPATLVGIVFGRNLGRLTAVLAAMAIAAIVLAVRSVSSDSLTHQPEQAIVSAELDHKPNIYLLLADGFSSFAYLAAKRIDVAAFKGWLSDRGFRLYEDTFSNYHATTDSLLSMLDMQHHYYRASEKSFEVSGTARQVIGGENNLVLLLRRNGFRTEYIHQGNYLLLQGCTADFCFPHVDKLSGARVILRKVLPRFLVGRGKEEIEQPMSVFRNEVSTQLGFGEKVAGPRFLYVHMLDPKHTKTKVAGRCVEEAEVESYSRRIMGAADRIESIVDEIIQKDHDAVIVVSGDHGPFIANRCEWTGDIDTREEYRDRVGVLTAIRWPKDYDNRFDGRIRTNINVFRYVLASLIDDSTEALGGHVPDDVFVRGDNQVLQILDDGEFVLPPVKLSAPELNELYVGDHSSSAH